MRAEIITIGDELLIGQVVDTNSAWMAEKLNEQGIELYQITSVHDDREHIINALNEAFDRADLVLTTGVPFDTATTATSIQVAAELFLNYIERDQCVIAYYKHKKPSAQILMPKPISTSPPMSSILIFNLPTYTPSR